MSVTPPPSDMGRDVRPVPIEDELIDSYLIYSMSVITARALPDARDGLKPVQRRVLASMRDLNLGPRAKHRKCAAIVGQCMGQYHPHGDSAIYEALVRMAQDFSMRGMLVDGHGNFGSIDGHRAAAMRYTESRMSVLAEEMLRDLDKDTVDYIPNFENTTTEPVVLPGKVPNLLVNGATGIAVGMATSMAPHNLAEVCRGVIALCDNEEISVDELMQHVKGPDFPTGGVICGRDGIVRAYKTGKGSVTIRARCHVETGKNDIHTIVVDEIPYQVTRTRIIEHVANQVRDKKIPGIANVVNESDRERGLRIAIHLKRGENPDVILNQLYKQTPLQNNFSINNIALVTGKPRTLNLKDMLEIYRDHRFEVIRRRTKFELDKAEARAHILEGLLKAIDAIDEVIAIIRRSPDVETARQSLMEFLDIDHIQAQAILDMQLRRLTSLEREKIQQEYDELLEKIREYKAILADPELVIDIIREDCYELIDKYGDERRSEIVASGGDIPMEDLIADEEMMVTITHDGYIKRLAIDTYRRQGRGGKGVTGMDVKDGDFIEHLFIASTHDYLLFFTTRGQVYWLKVWDLPEMSRTAKGRNMANLLELRPDEEITSMIDVRVFDDSHYLVMATGGGTVKKTVLSAFGYPRRGGIRAINLVEGDSLIGVVRTTGDDEIMLATRKGYACRFSEKDVRAMGREARGVRGIKLREADDACVGVFTCSPGSTVLTVCEKGMGKRSHFEDYRLTKRGAQGVLNIKITERNGPVVSCMTVTDEDELMVISTQGMVVRTAVKQVRTIGRATQGVSIVGLKEDDRVSAVARVMGEGGEKSENLPEEGGILPPEAGEGQTDAADAPDGAATGGEEAGDEPDAGGDA